MSFNRSYRQKIIDEYLNATGRNAFIPVEFLEWLKPLREHRAWDIFYGKSDAEAAHEYRLNIVRNFVATLRVTVRVAEDDVQPVTVKVPAFYSPVASRSEGGGYYQTDTSDGDTMCEMCRQASRALAQWVERHGGIAKIAGVDVSAVNQVVGELAAQGLDVAA